jgi:diguanylate cyclase (GGDEF)-like protein
MVLVGLSLFLLNRAWEKYRSADTIYTMSNGAEYFIIAFKDLTFERGRTNVILSSHKPATAADRSFIDTRRKSVDDNMNKGLEWLTNIDHELMVKLNSTYINLKHLREKADEIINKKSARVGARQKLCDEWFKQSTELLHQIIDTTDTIAKRQQLPGNFNNYYRYMIEALEFRDSIGRSGSILTAAVSCGRKTTPVEYRSIIENLSLADYLWSKMEVQAAVINDLELDRQKAVVRHTYYELYRPLLEDTILTARTGTVSPGRAKQLKELSVPAFDSVFTLKEQLKNRIGNEVRQIKRSALISLARAVIQFFAALSIIMYTVLYFRKNLFTPLSNLTGALQNIHAGKPVPDLTDEITRTDEIGLLAGGVKMLQESMYEERNLRKLTEQMAITDELTGLYNRHFLEKSIDRIINRSDRYNEPVTLVIFDLDHFKNVNDEWGHPAGDTVLRQTASIAKNLIRRSDMLIRFGGEEFILLMPHSTIAGGISAAEKIREALEKNEYPGIGRVTASFGVAERQKDESIENWYSRADRALYRAKQNGRNRVDSADVE